MRPWNAVLLPVEQLGCGGGERLLISAFFFMIYANMFGLARTFLGAQQIPIFVDD